MHETETAVVFLGEDQAGGIEERLGEDKAFQGRTISQRHGASAGEGFVPDIHKVRRVGVAKGAILDHGIPRVLIDPPLPNPRFIGSPA